MFLKVVLYSGAVTLLMLWLPMNFRSNRDVNNNPPKVTITSPLKTVKFQWNAVVPYSIAVVDREDGSSAYDEIPVQQVFMSIRYLPDSTQLKNYLRVESQVYQDVLSTMSTTTCFNCHQMKSKLIGPSFESISKKYPNTEASVALLANKVIKGTSGTWGDIEMPPNPDLEIKNVQQIVRWMLKNGGDTDQDYLRGVEGSFRTRQKPSIGSAKGVYVLTATYTDNGDKTSPESRSIGQYTVVLKSKD